LQTQKSSKGAEEGGTARQQKNTVWPFLLRAVALAVIVLVVCVRIRLLDVPLERDEGEYAYTGQLILQGIPPFRLSSNMKLPGTDAAYALSMAVFGQTSAGVHAGLLIVNLGAIALLFFLGRRLFGEAAGWVASASYALLTLGTGVLGTSAHATHFVVVPALGATLLMLRWNDSRRMAALFWSGLLYGLAVVMKQPGALFAIFGALYLLWTQRCHLRSGWRAVLLRFAVFALAVCLPLAITCLILWRAAVFPRFWFWTVTYGRAYGSLVPLAGGVQVFFRTIPGVVSPNGALWILGGAGLVLAWIKKRNRASALFATVFLAFSFLAVCPGFYFREHYFILMLPAVALLAGAAVAAAGDHLPGALPVIIFAGVVAISVIPQRYYFFHMGDAELSRRLYGPNPFPEAIAVADYIKNHSSSDARVAVLGSEPEIYFYAHRHSATDYIYTYALVEPQPYALQMQNEMIRDIEAARPEYIVVVNVATSWLFRPNSPMRIFNWFADYGPKHYDIVGVVDIISTTNTVYRWDSAAAAYQTMSPYFLRIFKRRS
jgi:hypothetical protein